MRREITIEETVENWGRCELCCEKASRVLVGTGAFQHHFCDICFYGFYKKLQAFDERRKRVGKRKKQKSDDAMQKPIHTFKTRDDLEEYLGARRDDVRALARYAYHDFLLGDDEKAKSHMRKAAEIADLWADALDCFNWSGCNKSRSKHGRSNTVAQS